MLTATFVIPHDHPSLAGHFPGNPITPGVVTLDHVAQGLLQQLPEMQLHGFPVAKFLNPVLPGVTVTVQYQEKSALLYQFTCRADEQIVLNGQIQIGKIRT